VIFEEAGEKEG